MWFIAAMGREKNPVEPLSLLFPKERGGVSAHKYFTTHNLLLLLYYYYFTTNYLQVPAHLLKAARNAAHQVCQCQ